MPAHWIRIASPDGTPPELEPFRQKPHNFEQHVADIVTGGGGVFQGLFYEAPQDAEAARAYVLFLSLRDTDVDGIVDALPGADRRADLATVTEHERSIRGEAS